MSTKGAKIARGVVSETQQLAQKGLVTRKMIVDYEDTKSGNLHSWLQHVLIGSAYKAGLQPLPEYKIEMEPHLEVKGKRPQGKYKADVALFCQGKLIGLAEAYTMDMAHGAYRTGTFGIEATTPGLKIPHVLKYGKGLVEKTVVIVVVLPKQAARLPPWADLKEATKGSKNLYQCLKPAWETLVSLLKQDVTDAHLVVVSEYEIWSGGVAYPLDAH